MSHALTGILLVVASALVESVAQIFLKVGAAGGPGILAAPYRRSAQRFAFTKIARTWIVIGVLSYVAEVFLYTIALHFLDVSVAFPLGSLCFIGVALLSKIFLGETVGRIRWLGVGCILAGTVLLNF